MVELHAPKFAMLASLVESEMTYRYVAEISVRNKIILSRETFRNSLYRVAINCDGLRALIRAGHPIALLGIGSAQTQLRDVIRS